MSQQKQRGPGSSGSSDIETGKPQDSRQSRYPGEGDLSKDPQQMSQQQPKHGKEESKQFGDSKGSSQQQGGQAGQNDQTRGGFERGRQPSQANFQGAPSGNQSHEPKSNKQQSQQGASQGDKQHGEGNYAASRDYNQRTKDFVESGRVDEAAKKAAPKNEREAKEMSDAEREGRRPMREEDPQINPDKSKKPGQGPDAKH